MTDQRCEYRSGMCSGSAVVLMRGGCVHEHVSQKWMCTSCLDYVTARAPLTCYPCHSGTDSHICSCSLAVVERIAVSS